MKYYEILCKDPVMQSLIEKYGELRLTDDEGYKAVSASLQTEIAGGMRLQSPKYFSDLAGAIVGQQLSAKAADTIWGRILNIVDGDMTAEKILNVSDEALRQAGCSRNKIRYIKNIAEAVNNHTLDLENIKQYDNEEIIRQLTAIKGVGRWTAEMFLIFSLAREDVFAFGDIGLLNAINKLYGKRDNTLNKEEVKAITEKWQAYRSYASLYLWKSLDNK